MCIPRNLIQKEKSIFSFDFDIKSFSNKEKII